MEKKTMGERFSHSDLPFVLLICFAYFHVVTSAPADVKTVLESMTVCPTVKFVHNSSYTAICGKQIVDTKVPGDDDNSYALCMMVNDIMSRICSFSSKSTITDTNKLTVPETSKVFDDAVKKLEPKPEEYNNFMATFCKNVSSMVNRISTVDPSNTATVSYLKYVNDTILREKECSFTCHKLNNKVNPLCMVLFWANDLFSSIKPLKTSSNKAEDLPSKKDMAPTIVKSIPKAVEEQPIEDQKSDIKSISKKQKSTNNKEEQHAVEKKKNVINPQDQQKIHTESKKVDKPDDLNPNVVNSNNNNDKEVMSFNVQNSEVGLKQVPDDQKAEDEGNLPPLSPNDKEGVAPNKADAPADSEIPQSEGNGESDINQNVKMEDKASDLDEQKGPDPGKVPQENPGQVESGQMDIPKFRPQSSIAKEEDESHFFTYFSIISLLCVGLYIGYHNKQKILAMVLEGRRSRRNRGSRRRPSTASYRKLDCNLEEAVTSQCNSNVTHVIY